MMQALEMQLLNTAFALLDQLYTEADARETREIVEICAGFCPKCTHTQVDSHMTDYLKISRRQLIRGFKTAQELPFARYGVHIICPVGL